MNKNTEPVDLYCRKPAKALTKKHRDNFTIGIHTTLTLVAEYFTHPAQVNKPHMLHRLTVTGQWEIWKIPVMVKGLRPGQWPRLWIGVPLGTPVIVPLVLDEHKSGYDDNTNQATAESRMREYTLKNLTC